MNNDVPARGSVTGTAEIHGGFRDFINFKNRIQAGPIIGGIVLAIAIMLILSVLGLAVGSTALKPRDVGKTVGVGAAIWGLISIIIGLFIGGWLAAKTSAVAGVGSGIANGLLVGAGAIVILVWLTASGFGGLIGVVGGNLGDIARVIENSGVSQNEAQQAAGQVDVNALFDAAKDSAWWTLVGLLLMLAAGIVGGWAGHNDSEGVVQDV